MTETPALCGRNEVKIQERQEELVEEYSDGSRKDGAAAGATTKEAEYLGRCATVMDEELLGISLSLEAKSCIIPYIMG